MRKLLIPRAPAGVLVSAVLIVCGCQSPVSVPIETIEEEPDSLASVVKTADPEAALQLVSGFHPVEGNAWRWTMGRFTVTLAPPPGSADKGAKLVLQFSVPDPIIERLNAVTLSAQIGEHTLEPATYSKAGAYVYEQEVPGEVMLGDALAVDFSLDKFLPPGEVDQRELGVVVTSVGFEVK